jgi:DNA-binding transcriptional MerR regulator
MRRSIGQVAKLSGVSIRTLRHYDEIGLLTPRARTGSGYRQYDDDDLTRLRHILFYRELGFPLDEIAALLDGEADSATHLAKQRDLLSARIARLQRIADAVETELEARRMGVNLTADERFEVFGDFKPEQYAKEVEERWGETDAYKESARRTATYGKEDWLRIQSETNAIEEALARLLASGAAPSSAEAMDLAEAHRQNISKWFYECGHGMHRCLAEMYVGDPRFTGYYDNRAPGLARFLHDAIMANAARSEGKA